MDDTKKALVAIILIFLFSRPSQSPAIEMEYVTQEQRQQLETLFTNATFSVKDHSGKMNGKSWTCDMYGVRSQLQVQRDVQLYNWSEAKGDVWQNKGAQLISSYKTEEKALIGHSGRLEDQVKFTGDGRLISQLSAQTPNAAQKVVIAYSVCKSL